MRSSSCICAVCALWAATSLAASAQTFKTLVSFNLTDGSVPEDVTLPQGRDGNLWGTTAFGGSSPNCSSGCGTAFRLTPSGVLTKVFSFDSTHGAFSLTGLVLGRDNNFYGVTALGGTHDDGVVFKLSPAGAETVLFDFDNTHGTEPLGALTQGTDGNFYGTTGAGGAGSPICGSGGCGTIFKITPSGTLTTLYNFDSTHGAYPFAGLLQATDGNFYGTTYAGGTSNSCNGLIGCGTVFRLTPAGALTVIHRFGDSDGAFPRANLVQATDGNLYGTAAFGGTSTNCGGGCGTVFKITRGGTLTTLYNFSGGTDGGTPGGPLVEGTDGNFYGTISVGGTPTDCGGLGCSTVFQITPSGVLTTLHSFSGTDGQSPAGGLVQHTNGLFYGTTSDGGTTCGGAGCGTVFSLDMGLGPFIKTTTTLGRVGSRVQILGLGLTGATSVTFNGTAATTFTIYADTYMTAIVPAGATTGPVQVATPTGTLTSNVSFRVTP